MTHDPVSPSPAPYSSDETGTPDSSKVANAVRCHDAVLTVQAPDGTRYELPVLWAEDGDVLPCWNDEAAETVARILDEQSAPGGKDLIVGLAVSLEHDRSVSSPVELTDTETGFFAEPQPVIRWVRQRLQ